MRYSGLDLHRGFITWRFWPVTSGFFKSKLKESVYKGELDDGVKVYGAPSEVYPTQDKIFPCLLIPEYHPMFNCYMIFHPRQSNLNVSMDAKIEIISSVDSYISTNSDNLTKFFPGSFHSSPTE